MESNKTDPVINCNCSGGSLHTSYSPRGGKLERATERRSCMDRVGESIWETRILRWCHRCKHEVPDWILSDRCDWCGGDVVEIGGKQDEN